MKTRTILLSLLLTATALALTPSAQAGIPEHCPEKEYSQTVDTRHTVAVHSDCTVDVTLFEGILCLGGAVGVRDETVGPVHLVQYYCRSPNEQPDLLDLSTTAMAPPPIIVCIREPCPGVPVPNYCTLESATPGANPYTTLNPRERVWGTDAGCDIDVESAWSCAPPSGGYVERTVGPLHVKVLVCDGGIGDLIEFDAIAGSAAQPPIYCVMAPCGPCTCPPPVIDLSYCKAKSATPDQVPLLGMAVNPRNLVWGTDAGCDVDVEGPDMTCAPPSSTGIDRTVGPVHVRAGVCDGGIPDRLGELIGPLVMT